ncbi:hypothetical protein [Alkalihalobacterium sp. APHAB7]|uniref:hypothetical protein n=1 Tax=Alkalihalobacterium sp. APHAB7 TaxID=3402081 RepID=UPI003AB048D3
MLLNVSSIYRKFFLTVFLLYIVTYWLEPYELRMFLSLLIVFMGIHLIISYGRIPKLSVQIGLFSVVVIFIGLLSEIIYGSSNNMTIVMEGIKGLQLIAMAFLGVFLAKIQFSYDSKFIERIGLSVLVFLMVATFISLFYNVPGLFNQEVRLGSHNLLGNQRGSAMYTEPGMLSNTVIVLWVFLYCLVSSQRRTVISIISIIICILSASLVGYLFALGILGNLIYSRKNVNKAFIFGLIFMVSVPIGAFVYENTISTRISFSDEGINADPSSSLKYTNIINILERDFIEQVIGSGIRANYRVTFDNLLLDGRANISDGFAFVNSSGVIPFFYFQYGIIGLLFIISLFIKSKYKYLFLLLLLTRYGDAAMLILILAFLSGREKNLNNYGSARVSSSNSNGGTFSRNCGL